MGEGREEYTEQMIIDKLSQYHDETYTFQYASTRATFRNFKLASVLVPLFVKDGEVHVVLTVRSSKMRHHKGEVAFPGGMKEEADEDEVTTSLRESQEEIGIDPDSVSVVAKLLPRVTRYRVYMVPVVGIISDDFVAVPNEEVEDVFTLPLSRFLSDIGHYTSQYTIRGVTGTIHFFHDEVNNGREYTTWGLTASVCVELAVALLGKKPEFKSESTPENPFGEQKRYLKEYETRSSL